MHQKKWEENVSLAFIYNDPFQSNKFLGPLPSRVFLPMVDIWQTLVGEEISFHSKTDK